MTKFIELAEVVETEDGMDSSKDSPILINIESIHEVEVYAGGPLTILTLESGIVIVRDSYGDVRRKLEKIKFDGVIL